MLRRRGIVFVTSALAVERSFVRETSVAKRLVGTLANCHSGSVQQCVTVHAAGLLQQRWGVACLRVSTSTP